MCSGSSQADDMERAGRLKTALYGWPSGRHALRLSARRTPAAADPTSMLDRPRKRIWPSLMRSALLNTSRQVVGLKNGSKPSNTSISATAPTSTSTMAAGGSAPRCGGGRRALRRAAHRPEELARRIEHHHVGAAAEARAIGLEAAIELRELRVAAERIGVQRRGLGVALALDLLRIAVGLGEDDLALLVGIGADASRRRRRPASAARWPPACAPTPCAGTPRR